jgi:hypothetical protein
MSCQRFTCFLRSLSAYIRKFVPQFHLELSVLKIDPLKCMEVWFQRTVSVQLWLFNASRICPELNGVCKITQEMYAEI